MQGYLSLVLHAHLPFVRHPQHERFLEESWLLEAIVETYIPLLQLLESWEDDRLDVRLALNLSPTLCSMLSDPLLQQRCVRRLDELVELAAKETHRTRRERSFQELAVFYRQRFEAARGFYADRKQDLIGAFRSLQDRGRLEIMTCAATHGLLPLLAHHPPSIRAQILIARDHYQACFGREPRGIWLPECAYTEGIERVLREANLRWFITDTHGILRAVPQPRHALFAPIVTPDGVAVFGRDRDSARQVWDRKEGYPGDPRYRDFYRDIGFDLDFEYVKPFLPAPGKRGFTGIKYFRSTAGLASKELYDRPAALQAAAEHAQHFIEARQAQIQKLASALGRPPIVVCPYDAELFGHWWYEGPEFLDSFVRKACANRRKFELITPEDYLALHPNLQIATPAGSTWGQDGHCGVWLNEQTHWIYPHLHVAQERMTELVGRFPQPDPLQKGALKQAGRELLLAQASDWPFIIHAGTSPDFARDQVKKHLARFTQIYEQISTNCVNAEWLAGIEAQDNIFPELDFRYWAANS